jgi:hypothetical protein
MSNNRNYRSAGVVGVALAAALIGLHNSPAAKADTDPGPFEELFGTAGINSWTPTADADLGPLAGGLDTSVENFLDDGSFSCAFGYAYCFDDPFTHLANLLDPSAFSNGLPDNAIGDLAVGLDYTTFSTGLGALLDAPIDLLNGFYFAL